MPFHALKFFLRRFFNRRSLEKDLQDEIQSHLAAEIRKRTERGESPDSAREAVLREFGNTALVEEVTRDMWGFTGLEQLMQDTRFAVRTLRKSPVFTLVALLVLALSIGSTTMIFTAVHAVLLRPLAFPDSGRLVALWEVPPETKKPNVVALNNFVVWKESSRSFEVMAAYFQLPANVLSGGNSDQVPGLRVTADFFHVLGAPPLLGRTFRPGEYDRDAPRRVVLSYGFWQRRFGGRPDIIGQRISIDASHHEVIGVLPPDFRFPGVKADLYTPLPITLDEGRNYSVIARLRKGITPVAAKSEIAAIANRTAQQNPALNAGWSATVIPLLDQTIGAIRPVLLTLFAAVSLLLLLACVNIANLLLMRSARRAREISVRLALGAGSFRIARQLLVESLFLSALGGALGVFLAAGIIRLVVVSLPPTLSIPRMQEITFDWTVCAFSILVTFLAGLLFGLAPALVALKTNVVRDLHGTTRSVTSGLTVRKSLVIAETALAFVLVAAAGLMTRSFLRLIHIDPGFHAEHVITLRMLLLPVRDEAFHAEVTDQILQRVRTLPGVLAAGSIGVLPMIGTNSGTWYGRADRPDPPLNQRGGGDVSIITPGYFRALGIPVLKGRDFDERDRPGAPRVAVINQTAARMLFGREDPIGKLVRVWWTHSPKVEVVGVIADIRHSQLTAPPDPCLFMPNDQAPFPFSSLVVRTMGDPSQLTAAIREQIRQVDADQGIAEVETMSQLIADSVARQRFETILFAAFGSVALLLACLGIYGVIAYSVAQRTREVGIRVALGATRASVFRMVMGDGFRLTVIGIIAGGAGAVFLTRYLRTLLFETQPNDPPTLIAVSGLLIFVALLACYIPAARAMTVDPSVVLREE
ncbi:MAG: ABC transporter permease [Acidobacteriaceae bacterium]|nr:ABC transporter permease [Acidobacteriaceae bacterium]